MTSKSNSYSNQCIRDLAPKPVDVKSLAPLGRETRKHPATQIRKLARNLERFGFVLPIVIDQQSRVVAGWGLVQAAQWLELPDVPAVTITDLDEAELRTLRLSLNRLGEDADWDHQALMLELSEIIDLDTDISLELTGFEMGEIDLMLAADIESDEDDLPPVKDDTSIVTCVGDVWELGDHRIVCADALKPESYELLMAGERAQMVFTDPPYNVPVDGHVCGSGKVKHAEFAMAAGEMSPEEFEAFLKTALGYAVAYAADGSIHYVCMDWRHMGELMSAGTSVYTELKNLCVWSKTNGGMGSLYRSQHELVFVFKAGKAKHVNNVALGRHGRYRTNVWTYAGQSSFGGLAHGKLDLHPTVKPVALVADAIRDCSKRGDIILDPFGGSGSTLIAAERTGRMARLIEFEPRYVDVTVERWQRLSGKSAVHAVTRQQFGQSPTKH